MTEEVVFSAAMSPKNRLITYAVGWGVFEEVRPDSEAPRATLGPWALNGLYGLHGTF